MYQRALGGRFETIYVDAFAGSGEVPLDVSSGGLIEDDDDAKNVIVGSAERAVSVEPSFNSYMFIDKRRECIESLRQRFADKPNFGRFNFRVGDANKDVSDLCAQSNWRFKRGVVFLDPFGNQVRWDTIVAIAETRALDLWYLFPAGAGVFRQIGRDGSVDPTHIDSLDRLFGTTDWQSAFVEQAPADDLFGPHVRAERVVTPESAADFMINRMKGVFRGGVLDQKIALGRHAYPSYYLIFAWGNDSPKATQLAERLSKAAIKATDRKYGRAL